MTKPRRPIIFPPTEPSSATGFAGGRLERLSEKRADPLLTERLRTDPAARLIVFASERAVLRRDADGATDALWPLAAVDRFGAATEDIVLLGFDGDVPVFAVAIDREPGDLAADDATVFIQDLRSLAQEGVLAADVTGAVAQGRSLTGWHARHRFCANCGAPTTSALAGYRRDCARCGAHHFPRTDPVVIMLAIDGDRGLLGRQPRFKPGMYSCLAGFVEPGETLENAVRRELGEEAGITVGRVAYHASQPWPFPSTLMIGCFAEALSTDITREEEELEDVRFFSRAEMASMLEEAHPGGLTAPPAMAIAHHLIRAFVMAGSADA